MRTADRSFAQRWSRILWLLGAAILPCGVVFVPVAPPGGIAMAQVEEEASGGGETAVEEEPEEEAAVEPGGAGGGPAPPSAAGASPENDTAVAPSRTLLSWTFEALGWTYSIIFLALSFIAVAVFVMNVIAARRDNVIPVRLVTGFEQRLNERRWQEAYDLARGDESFLGHVLAAGLAKFSASGYSQAIEAMQEVGEDESMKLEHRLSYLALIGTISPMVGLFGTVHGMIMSFMVIADSTTQPPPSELAKGIATALYTTLVGLLIAIPTIGAYGILRNRFARLVLEVGIISENLMSRFQNVGVKKPPASPQQAAPSPTPPSVQPQPQQS